MFVCETDSIMEGDGRYSEFYQKYGRLKSRCSGVGKIQVFLLM